MTFIKPSTAFKAGADWVSAEVRSYMKDQVATHLDTVADLQNSDLEQTRFVYLKTKAALYRLNLSSGAADDGDTVIHDNVGRRYEKVLGSDGVQIWDAAVDDIAARAAYDAEAEGFVVLVSDAGDGRAAIYVMGSGGAADWGDPAYLTGPEGQAATISVGDVTTVAAGAAATVTNVGSSSAAVFDFEIPQGIQGIQGDQGIQGPVGEAYESYGVSIYKSDGIEPGGYYAERSANAASTQAKLYAEIIAGDAGAEVDLYVEVAGAPAYGPFTVEQGTPVDLSGLTIAVAGGDAVSFVVTAVIGTVTDLFAKTYGAVS